MGLLHRVGDGPRQGDRTRRLCLDRWRPVERDQRLVGVFELVLEDVWEQEQDGVGGRAVCGYEMNDRQSGESPGRYKHCLATRYLDMI